MRKEGEPSTEEATGYHRLEGKGSPTRTFGRPVSVCRLLRAHLPSTGLEDGPLHDGIRADSPRRGGAHRRSDPTGSRRNGSGIQASTVGRFGKGVHVDRDGGSGGVPEEGEAVRSGGGPRHVSGQGGVCGRIDGRTSGTWDRSVSGFAMTEKSSSLFLDDSNWERQKVLDPTAWRQASVGLFVISDHSLFFFPPSRKNLPLA